MDKKATLALEDGSVYQGYSFGADVETFGEVVFCTSMIGYQEMLTDPSFAGQILVPTYPLIGNYGINSLDIESGKIQVQGFIVREQCLEPSHYLSNKTIHQYLKENKIPGIYGIDTRALTRRLRTAGVMMGIITTHKTPQQALEELRKAPSYGTIDFVKKVTTQSPYQRQMNNKEALYHVVILDCGLKYNIVRILLSLGCCVTVVPCTTPAEEIIALKPDGVLLSPGPGDPELLDYITDNVKQLIGKHPIMGICLGNQLIARAYGATTFKLKFGHRGGNHPVRELASGRVYITAQNHGYAVDATTVKNGLEVTHINLNDDTVEGLRLKDYPVFAIQYHSEASPGPLDNTYLFDRFITMIKESK
jgi:carbamoyl-phosphate synthase small subunit